MGRWNETGLRNGDRVSFGGRGLWPQLSRRRLATSRDMGWKMASPTDGKNRFRDPSSPTFFAPLSASWTYIYCFGSSPFSSTSLPWDAGVSSSRRFFTAAPEMPSSPGEHREGLLPGPAAPLAPFGWRTEEEIMLGEKRCLAVCSILLLGHPIWRVGSLIFYHLERFSPP